MNLADVNIFMLVRPVNRLQNMFFSLVWTHGRARMRNC